MAAALKQLTSSLKTYSSLISTHGSKAYQQVLEKNKQHIVDDGNIEKAAELGKKYLFTTLASLPKRVDLASAEFEAVKRKVGQQNNIQIAEVGVAALFLAETYAWFCVGEVVGRGFTVTGYKP